jgi:DNA helicase-2/ATP-dependent DNA helicase PcrA
MEKQNLNPAQEKAVNMPDTPLLIIAGAGTGKTKTLTNRIAHLIASGARPEKICAMTFTNKAAREMLERVAELANGKWHITHGRYRDIFGAPNPYIGTFHSFGARLLRMEARKAHRTPQFAIFDASDSMQVMRRIVKDEGVKEDAPAGEMLDLVSKVKSGTLTLDDLKMKAGRAGRYAADIFPIYEDALREQNAFDFDDLLDKTARLLEEHPDVLEKYRERFSHILVDEYQDVNNRQYDLIRLLAGEHKRLSVVGDDQQTIYSWRGSNLNIFLGFERDWPGAQTTVLDQNYRSTSTIIDAASTLIANNQKQKSKKLWTKNPAGEPILLIEAADEDQEAEWIAEQIAKSKAQSAKDTDAEPFALGHLRSSAVLYRTNAQSRPIEQALIARNIPYRIYGGLKFYERKEVKDIIAAVRWAVNPKDSVSRERLEKAPGIRAFREFAEAVRDVGTKTPAELIGIFIDTTDYMGYLRRTTTNLSERQDNVAELIRFAGEFENTTAFLEQVALVQSTDDAKRDERDARVALMTMHLAKGLEFDRVFIAGCGEGVLPHNRSMGSDEELEEERRLMYVAMTRARKNLAISFYDIPSRFVSELPQELLEYRSLVSDETQFSDSEERYITLD